MNLWEFDELLVYSLQDWITEGFVLKGALRLGFFIHCLQLAGRIRSPRPLFTVNNALLVIAPRLGIQKPIKNKR